MYNQVSSKCSLTLQVKAWQYNDRDNYKIEIKEHINYVWIANYQEEIEIEDGIVDNFSNPLNNRNGYHNSIVSENVLLLWFISIYPFGVVLAVVLLNVFVSSDCCSLIANWLWSRGTSNVTSKISTKEYIMITTWLHKPNVLYINLIWV